MNLASTANEVSFLCLIPLLPLLGAFFIGLTWQKLPRVLAGWIACLAVAGSFGVSFHALAKLNNLAEGQEYLSQHLWTWINTSSLNIQMDLMVDPITVVMLLVVAGVGLLIHIFSLWYMGDDEESNRYFCHLNLFVAFMLLLVTAKNLPVMFIGWEGVGACSYLLIGYYYRDEAKAQAGKKAFVVNRVGDTFFVLGLMVLAYALGNHGIRSLDFVEIESHLSVLADCAPISFLGYSVSVIPLVCLLLFIGATGKSAQIPLYVWLPDAMAGPTPVSALIHAATMVTAGVYMICRLDFLYAHDQSVWVSSLVAWTGAITALLAALVAVKQTDIKKILAYSTMSQLGYMFIACGVHAFSFALFHLFTHSFFKALLFLAAGVVIHTLKGEQDILQMGGLRSRLRGTYVFFIIGALTLSGIPPLSGFVSKDHILWAAFQSPKGGSVFLFFCGFLTAGLTAFYMFRLIALVFWGESRLAVSKREKKAIHEDFDNTMFFPLVLLAALSIGVGFLNIPDSILSPFHLESKACWFSYALQGCFKGAEAPIQVDTALEDVLMLFTVLMVVFAILLARRCYANRDWWDFMEGWEQAFGGVTKLVENKFYMDECYDFFVVRPTLALSKFLKVIVDEEIIDNYLLTGSVNVLKNLSREAVGLQNGDVQRYLIALGLGALGVVFYFWNKLVG